VVILINSSLVLGQPKGTLKGCLSLCSELGGPMVSKRRVSPFEEREEETFINFFLDHDAKDALIVLKIEYEIKRLEHLETAISLAERKGAIRNKIIKESLENPEFLNHLNETLKRLGL
jgi:hypothetical protein